MKFRNTLLAGAAVTMVAAFASTGAQANLLVNGSFETGDTTGWTDSYGQLNPFGTTYGSGMDGKYWAWLAGYETDITLTQTVNGLVAGDSYTLTFIQASEAVNMDQVRVSVNGGPGTLFTSPADITGGPGNGYWNNWVKQTYTFTAGSSTDTIQFDTNGLNAGGYDVGIDNVILSAGGVPEPASWAMMMLGVFGVGALMRRRKAALA